MSTFNRRFAYVSVSRASHDAQIYTNDAESLSRDVTKASALDFGNVQTRFRVEGKHHTSTRWRQQGLDWQSEKQSL
jgi:hypothetical protein